MDSNGSMPLFQVNERAVYWIHNGQLLRSDTLGPQYIGDVLPEQTQFWVGSHFGFGFYRAGNLSVAFVFDAKRSGIQDKVALSLGHGQFVDATCYFTPEYCWFFLATQEQGKRLHRCTVLRSDGSIVASTQREAGEGDWLSTLQGKVALNHFLLAATDEGIVRVEPINGQIVKTKEFPDTEPFVDSHCHLFPGPQGLQVVQRQAIYLLKLH